MRVQYSEVNFLFLLSTLCKNFLGAAQVNCKCWDAWECVWGVDWICVDRFSVGSVYWWGSVSSSCGTAFQLWKGEETSLSAMRSWLVVLKKPPPRVSCIWWMMACGEKSQKYTRWSIWAHVICTEGKLFNYLMYLVCIFQLVKEYDQEIRELQEGQVSRSIPYFSQLKNNLKT